MSGDLLEKGRQKLGRGLAIFLWVRRREMVLVDDTYRRSRGGGESEVPRVTNTEAQMTRPPSGACGTSAVCTVKRESGG